MDKKNLDDALKIYFACKTVKQPKLDFNEFEKFTSNKAVFTIKKSVAYAALFIVIVISMAISSFTVIAIKNSESGNLTSSQNLSSNENDAATIVDGTQAALILLEYDHIVKITPDRFIVFKNKKANNKLITILVAMKKILSQLCCPRL